MIGFSCTHDSVHVLDRFLVVCNEYMGRIQNALLDSWFFFFFLNIGDGDRC